MIFSRIIQSIRLVPGTAYVRVGKEELEIPRGVAFQQWLDAITDMRLEIMVALAIKEQLSIEPNQANLPAALANKRVVVTVSLENP